MKGGTAADAYLDEPIRLMRPHPGKTAPVLYDLVDDAPMTRRQWTARKRAYRKVLGGTFTTNGACAWGAI